ncbi:MarR family transcriptional regulator [Anaeromassilibacillus sp. SJQ-1]|uniref:MarR family transcriptional regulator n=1 Tax=Anaeromassilibacillus sp. SJQ-1 TaxID=3375419 RepID=UPI003988FDDF
MLEAELHFLLLCGFHYSNKAISQKVLALGLYPGQPKILEYLLEHDGAIAKEIGEGCVIDKSTIANLLVRMERQNLLYKRSIPWISAPPTSI